jgi:crotonobetainyl-CoA:carnitine CoA-transferase CaiB-like acyl-CoA transferase
LVTLFDGVFATRTRDEWLSIFSEYDLFCAGVNTLMDLQNDPQILANDYLIDFDHPTMGRIKVPGYPVHFSESRAGTVSAAPELGEHTDEVLIRIGGYSEEEISDFRKEGII